MSVDLSDFSKLPCSPELISAGIAFTCRSHLRLFMTRSRVPISHLRRLCADSIASVALRRWLTSETIPHGLVPTAPLTEPHTYQITLGGRRLQLVNHLISNRRHIRKLGRNPQLLLQTGIAAADTHTAAARLSPGDLLAYSFLIANVCHDHSETKRRTDAKEMASLLAIPPRAIWRQQRPWQPLGQLVLTNSDDHRLDLELCGLSTDRSAAIEHVSIPIGQSKQITTTWHNLLHVHTVHTPKATLRIQCPVRSTEWFITPSSWSNLWLYQPRLLLLGWLTKREFERVATPRSRMDQALQVRRPRRNDSIIQVQALRPIRELLQKARHMQG